MFVFKIGYLLFSIGKEFKSSPFLSIQSNIANLPQGNLQSVQHTKPSIFRPSIWIRKTPTKKPFNKDK